MNLVPFPSMSLHPTLGRNMVAQKVGVSVRWLNAIFAKEESSLSAFIRDSRFQVIAEELLNFRLASLSISEITCKYGFENF
ncbi:MAG: hypothetical protein COA71_13925 [SAR86 cluster bacterium]|uniref:HTH araC/xylS-type domain-containing protein n=1 Tax=SAR86 cluster bacterium TaxID=2030880 RepID=A0A2A5C6G2_9GAMM|nr:hypothetical protein [Gammaproteobacteria bacterium AH-315-E17]PCJ39363.1 MAG: hypothetical protein COA71_13925 [SAR86 cluster bacterium]